MVKYLLLPLLAWDNVNKRDVCAAVDHDLGQKFSQEVVCGPGCCVQVANVRTSP